MSGQLRRLPSQTPHPCRVEADRAGRPLRVDDCRVDVVREEWRVEEGWWAEPCRRRCFALVLDDGRLCMVYEDRRSRSWWRYGG